MTGTEAAEWQARARDESDAVSLCSLRTGAGTYGIDTRRIREVLGKTLLQRVPRSPTFIGGVVPYRGEVLTTVSFRALLGLETQEGTNCVLVLEDPGSEERFGLAVDGMYGVVMVSRQALEANPSALDARHRAIFDGAYRMDQGLIVQLDPEQLRPSRLAESGLFVSPMQRERA